MQGQSSSRNPFSSIINSKKAIHSKELYKVWKKYFPDHRATPDQQTLNSLLRDLADAIKVRALAHSVPLVCECVSWQPY
mgnify:CR=1 FL=1